MITESVPAALAGERLDRVVALVGDISRSAASALIEAGGVILDGEPATSGKVRLAEGQTFIIDLDAQPQVAPPGPDPTVAFEVVYADDDIAVIDKPAGVVVHPGAGNREGTLVSGLLARFGSLADVGDPDRPGIVHRLDAGSSGLLVVALTDRAVAPLVSQFVDHSAGRTYTAVVWGHPASSRGIIDAPVGRSRRDPLRMAVVADGRPSRTEYRVIEHLDRISELSLIECRLETGRTHQIRVHLSSIGHPLVGDPVYGQRRPHLGLKRPFLHAAELSFEHPIRGEVVTFTSPLPADLSERRDAFRH